MKEGKFYCACHEVPSKFFGWVACVIRTHNWETVHRWHILGTAEMICHRCGQVQFLDDVPHDWDGRFNSRRFDPTIAILTALIFLVPAVIVITLILQ